MNKQIIFGLSLLLILNGCMEQPIAPHCSNWNTGYPEEDVILQRELCESKGYFFQHSLPYYDCSVGRSIPYSSKCTSIDKNIIVKEYGFQKINGEYVLEEN